MFFQKWLGLLVILTSFAACRTAGGGSDVMASSAHANADSSNKAEEAKEAILKLLPLGKYDSKKKCGIDVGIDGGYFGLSASDSKGVDVEISWKTEPGSPNYGVEWKLGQKITAKDVQEDGDESVGGYTITNQITLSRESATSVLVEASYTRVLESGEKDIDNSMSCSVAVDSKTDDDAGPLRVSPTEPTGAPDSCGTDAALSPSGTQCWATVGDHKKRVANDCCAVDACGDKPHLSQGKTQCRATVNGFNTHVATKCCSAGGTTGGGTTGGASGSGSNGFALSANGKVVTCYGEDNYGFTLNAARTTIKTEVEGESPGPHKIKSRDTDGDTQVAYTTVDGTLDLNDQGNTWLPAGETDKWSVKCN